MAPCLWSEVYGSVLQKDLLWMSSYRVEIELKIRLSGSPANHQHHIFLVMSVQMWGSIPGRRQLLAQWHHYLWNYMCSGIKYSIHFQTKAR